MALYLLLRSLLNPLFKCIEKVTTTPFVTTLRDGMNSKLLRKLELTSTQRKQAKVSSVGPPTLVGGNDKVLAIKIATTAMKNENLPLIAKSRVSSLEATIKAPPEEIPTKETPMEEMQAIDAVGHPKETSVMVAETGDPLE